MPTTANGIWYPASTDGPNIWEHMQAQANSIEPLITKPVTILALAADQNLPASATIYPISFSGASEVVDDLNWHSPSANPSQVKPTKPGRYLVNLNVYFAANATGDRRIYVQKNGAVNHVWQRAIANGVNGLTVSVTGVITCNGTTDYIEGAAYQSSGGALLIQGSGDTTFSTSMEVVYIGPIPA